MEIIHANVPPSQILHRPRDILAARAKAVDAALQIGTELKGQGGIDQILDNAARLSAFLIGGDAGGKA